MASVSVLAAEFAEISRELRTAGDDDLRRELFDAIDHAAQPAAEDVRRRLPEYLPNPYAADLAGSMRINISKLTGTRPGVSVVAPERVRGRRRRLVRLNAGTLAHPLFGNRRHWYEQAVKPLFFDQPIEDHAPQVRDGIEAALERVKDKIYLGAHL